MATLLAIVRRACALCSVPPPSAVMGATGGVGATMAALAQVEGEELASRHDWRQLRGEMVFTATGQSCQLGRLPDDYDRMVSRTLWNRTRNQMIAGPVDGETWAQLSTALGAPIAQPVYRIMSQDFNVLPAPAAGETLAFEYQSNAFVEAVNGTLQSEWLDDTDSSRLPTNLMVFGLVWRWKAAKGLDYAEDMSTYERAIETATIDDYGTIATAYAFDSETRPPVPSVVVVKG